MKDYKKITGQVGIPGNYPHAGLEHLGNVLAFPSRGIYHASKWAVEGRCESLSQAVKPFNIHVTLVEPGSYATDWGTAAAAHSAPNPTYNPSAPLHMTEPTYQQRLKTRKELQGSRWLSKPRVNFLRVACWLRASLSYDKPKYPLPAVLDLARLPRPSQTISVRLGLYGIGSKHFDGVLAYDRGPYDFREGTLFFTAPSQALIPSAEAHTLKYS